LDITYTSDCEQDVSVYVSNFSTLGTTVEGSGEYDAFSPTKALITFFSAGEHTMHLENTAPAEDSFTFVVVGDNRDGPETFSAILEEIDSTAYPFCINTGDIIPSGQRSQFDDFFAMVDNISLPLYISIGNHELNNNSPELAATYLGELTYSFDYGNTHFVILDNSLYDITEETYLWIQEDIAQAGKDNVVLACHVPPYDPREGESHSLTGDDAERFIDFMADNGVDLVLCGHIHLYDERMIQGVQYIISAGGGAPLYAPESEGGFFHYTLVTIDGNDISHEVVKVTSPLYTPDIAQEKLVDATQLLEDAQQKFNLADQRVTELEEQGATVTIYRSKLSTVEQALVTSSLRLQDATTHLENEYWHDSIVSASASQSYALQALINAENVYEAVEDIKPPGGTPVLYYAAGIVIVAALFAAVVIKKRG
jgi:DNA repair exonuclease SbcCD nuclease subunit